MALAIPNCLGLDIGVRGLELRLVYVYVPPWSCMYAPGPEEVMLRTTTFYMCERRARAKVSNLSQWPRHGLTVEYS